jgi:hypothetical protein
MHQAPQSSIAAAAQMSVRRPGRPIENRRQAESPMPFSFRLWKAIAGTGEGGTGFSLCEKSMQGSHFIAPAKAGATQIAAHQTRDKEN